MTRTNVAFTIALAAASGACSNAPAARHAVLDDDVTALRDAFNADSGHVRAVFLASPT